MSTSPLTPRAALPIEFHDVSKTYPDGTVAVAGIDLECRAGETTVFVGPSGCGKTTSLRMINRMVEPTGGALRIGGTDVLDLDPIELRRHIGYVIQNAGLFPHRTVADNISTVPRMLGRSRRDARAGALELMERVGLDPAMADKYPARLSGGQQQRVGVARALAADPPVLLMDEPFSAVDPVVRTDLQDELLRLQRDLGKTIVFVTHDIDEAIRLADRIVVFERGGRIAQTGAPDDILLAPADLSVQRFLGGAAGIRLLSIMPAAALLERGGRFGDERLALERDPSGRPTGWRTADGEHHPLERTLRADTTSVREVLDALVVAERDATVLVDADGTALGAVDLRDISRAVIERKHAHA